MTREGDASHFDRYYACGGISHTRQLDSDLIPRVGWRVITFTAPGCKHGREFVVALL